VFTLIKNIKVYASRFASYGGFVIRVALKANNLKLLKPQYGVVILYRNLVAALRSLLFGSDVYGDV
jgi:hypothetical protein